jgi:hypothetical protein
MRADVEQEAVIGAERGGVAAEVGVLVVHHRRQAVGVQPMRGAESGHAGSKNHDVQG